MPTVEVQRSDIEYLLYIIYDIYGYDFRQYSEAHIRRRVLHRMLISDLGSVQELSDRVGTDRAFAGLLLQDLSITVTEMFRDPDFYRALRAQVIPFLRTYSFIRIWHAGCATGQEVYSMAILLQEEGLYDRTTIYATDFNQHALDFARDGVYPMASARAYTANYQRSGGSGSFAGYYTSGYDHLVMERSLKDNIVWAHHNLVTDHVFAEVHLVLCRNVLIYFNKDLQRRALSLFTDSLVSGGVLALGSRESLQFSGHEPHYHPLDARQRLFRKKYGS